MALATLTSPACIVCGESTTLNVDVDRYKRWRDGELIQRVWPDWTADQRELLITGTHPQCWRTIFRGR